MNKKEFSIAVERMVDAAGLRSVSSRFRLGKNWIGVCSGIQVVMNLDTVRLQIDLSSPDLADDTIEVQHKDDDSESIDEGRVANDSPFRRAVAKGISETWFEQYEGELWGFQLIIDNQRQRELRPEALEGLLEAIALDLHDFGAETFLPCCECQRDATTLGCFEDFSTGPYYAPYCTACWEQLQSTTRGAIRISEPQAIRRGLAFLAFVSVVFAIVWGGAQHPALGIPFGFLFIGCAGAGVATAMSTAWAARGSNLGLRISVATSVLLATLAGNMIGIKFVLGPAISWLSLIPTYFESYLSSHLGQELLFLACGAVGVVIGFVILRETERMRLR